MLCNEGKTVETGLVGAAGTDYFKTADFNVLDYKKLMDVPCRVKHFKGIDEEKHKNSRNDVFEEVNVDDFPYQY